MDRSKLSEKIDSNNIGLPLSGACPMATIKIGGTTMKRILIAILIVTVVSTMPALAGKINDTNFEVQRSDWPCNQQGDANLCIPLDSSWDVVEFTIGVADCFENDDGSSVAVSLGFAFDLFGSPQTECYIVV